MLTCQLWFRDALPHLMLLSAACIAKAFFNNVHRSENAFYQPSCRRFLYLDRLSVGGAAGSGNDARRRSDVSRTHHAASGRHTRCQPGEYCARRCPSDRIGNYANPAGGRTAISLANRLRRARARCDQPPSTARPHRDPTGIVDDDRYGYAGLDANTCIAAALGAIAWGSMRQRRHAGSPQRMCIPIVSRRLGSDESPVAGR